MVIDSLKNSAKYACLNPHFAKAFYFLATTDISRLAPGRYPIDGDNAWANIVQGDLKKVEDAKMEAHDAYIDIQICIHGKETFGWIKREACRQPAGEYDAAKDLIFFEDAATTFFSLTDGEMAIFFPEDGHQPMIGQGPIQKCILKIKA
jgi:YhcH/YjgK/YiaL family protein